MSRMLATETVDWFVTFSTMLAVLVCGVLYAAAWVCTLPWQAVQRTRQAFAPKPTFRVVYAAGRPATLPMESAAPSRTYSRAA